MADDPILNQTVPDQRTAKKLARTLGCQGAHKAPGAEDGGWHPCESQEALRTLIEKGMAGYRAWKARTDGTKSRTIVTPPHDIDEKKRGRKRRFQRRRFKKWEKLNERGVSGIDTLPSGGLVRSKHDT